MKVIDLRADYEVGDDDVELTITIGDGQIGTSVVKLGTKELGRGAISDLPIGAGPSIKTKSLTTKSIVTDVNDRTNKTSVTYVLTGGVRDQTFQSLGTVDQNGDVIICRAAFKLV